MPRRAAGLTAAKVRTAQPGRYCDGGGLYLLTRSPEARFWLFRYVRSGRMREMGLGPAAGRDAVSLAEARAKAADLRKLLRAGVDPLAQRAADAAAAKAARQGVAAQAMTFRAVAERYLNAHATGWRNAKHRAQCRSTLETHAFPHFGDLPVRAVQTAHVMTALEPIWHKTAETARRVRGRIEAVLDYATAREWRSGENPARWRGHLSNLLPARSKVAPVEHHAALPWSKMGAFMEGLRQEAGVSAGALEFAILTAARSGEVRGARWSEIDMQAGIWTIPTERMKARKEHRVPLSAPTLALLGTMAKLRTVDKPDGFVFPGRRAGQPLGVTALAKVLQRMQRSELTVHGFRSSFRDWVAEATGYPREVAEAALAHVVGNKVEAAYQRGDLFEKRRRLMEEWAEFCSRSLAQYGRVVAIRA